MEKMETVNIKIDGEITIPADMTCKQFLYEFILFIESKGWYFNGITQVSEIIKDEIQIKKYLADHVNVNIIHNDDIGEWLWSVEVVNSDEFWLDSFKTKEEAVEYCEKHELKIVEIDSKLTMEEGEH